jgi:hypothetical protein
MTNKLIHVANIQVSKQGKQLLLLRERSPHDYGWFLETDEQTETDTGVRGDTIEEAMQIAHRHWRLNYFKTIICGFRYTLPERDECGMNALFHQMAASHSTTNGIYFDEDLGHNCFVQNASQESLDLHERFKSQKRL